MLKAGYFYLGFKFPKGTRWTCNDQQVIKNDRFPMSNVQPTFYCDCLFRSQVNNKKKVILFLSLPLPHSTSCRFNLDWPCRLSSFDPLILTCVSYIPFLFLNLIQPFFIRKAPKLKNGLYLFVLQMKIWNLFY